MALKAGFGRLATMGEAFDILYSHLPDLGREEVPISECLHRVLATDVVSKIDVPHFAKAAMDGYAVIASETFGASDTQSVVLAVSGSVMPGQVAKDGLTEGECIEIGTGAPLPAGSDAVVMVEYTEPAGNEVHIRKPVAPSENVVGVGSDVSAGSIVLTAGTLLEPRHLGVLAAVGLSSAKVVARPSVALFSTGPEIVEPGGELLSGQIFDINSYTLRAALHDDGCDVVDLGIVPDQPDVLEDAIRKGLDEADLVLLSGGSSLGGGDLVVETFEKIGKVLVHGVAVKPGKPLVLGEAAGGLMIGLPGYPMSALSDYYIFVQAFLHRAMGVSSGPRSASATLARKHPSTVGRYEFLPVSLEEGMAIPIVKGSSAISALAQADGFIEIDENTEVVEKGQPVVVRLF